MTNAIPFYTWRHNQGAGKHCAVDYCQQEARNGILLSPGKTVMLCDDCAQRMRGAVKAIIREITEGV